MNLYTARWNVWIRVQSYILCEVTHSDFCWRAFSYSNNREEKKILICIPCREKSRHLWVAARHRGEQKKKGEILKGFLGCWAWPWLTYLYDCIWIGLLLGAYLTSYAIRYAPFSPSGFFQRIFCVTQTKLYVFAVFCMYYDTNITVMISIQRIILTSIFSSFPHHSERRRTTNIFNVSKRFYRRFFFMNMSVCSVHLHLQGT